MAHGERKEPTERVCPGCGKRFMAVSKTRVWCTKLCYGRHYGMYYAPTRSEKGYGGITKRQLAEYTEQARKALAALDVGTILRLAVLFGGDRAKSKVDENYFAGVYD